MQNFNTNAEININFRAEFLLCVLNDGGLKGKLESKSEWKKINNFPIKFSYSYHQSKRSVGS